jgi:phage/plasmid primase-like uncharacterized protein
MSVTPLLDQFRHAIEQAGLTAPDSIIPDGKLHRFASNGDRDDDAGWYVLFADGIPAGSFGCWRAGLMQKWCAKSDVTMSPTERVAHRRRVAELQRIRQEEEKQAHEAAAQRAQTIWDGATPAPADHPYLQRKGIRPHGVRVDDGHQLIVPVVIGDTIASVQFISPDPTVPKKFLYGGASKDGYFFLGEQQDDQPVLVCEGFATAASVHEATGTLTVVAFSAGNVGSVAAQARQQFPTSSIVLCGDHDPSGVGQRAAREAAQAIGGIVAIPDAIHNAKTDWNDVHVLHGLDAVKSAIEAAIRTAQETPAMTTTMASREAVDDAHVETAGTEQASEATFQLVTASDSFITHYIQYAAMRTDAPLDAHEALGFGILSALAGPSVTLPIATAVKGWRLTLWLLYLVNSTVGRKSTTLDLAVDVVRAVLGETALIHWEGSPQGLLQRLQTRDGQASVFVRDEYSGLMAGMNRGGHLAGLPQLLIKGYDGSVLENVRTRKRGADGDTHSDTDRVECPYLVQFAAAPWDAFVERATLDNVWDGFIPRFDIVMGSALERGLPMITEAIQAAGAAVYDQARAYSMRAQTIQQVAIAPGVLARQWALEQDYRRRAQASARPDAAGPSLKRLAETALKLSALLAIEDPTGTVLSIHEAHFVIATQITDKWAGNALRLIEALGRTTFQRDCEQVLHTIQQRSAGIPKGQLYRLHQRLRMRDFEEILSALEAQERITIEKAETTGRGRPSLIVRAIKGV